MSCVEFVILVKEDLLEDSNDQYCAKRIELKSALKQLRGIKNDHIY